LAGVYTGRVLKRAKAADLPIEQSAKVSSSSTRKPRMLGREADLLVKNATGSTISVKQDGGRIYARKTTNGLIALTVFYDDTAITEDYVFQLDDRG
jgi:hypothetical protein